MDILKRDGDERLVESESFHLSELFKSLVESGERPLRILIRADAGFGKSTLCTKIAYDWAKGIQTFDSFPCESTLVLKYRLRDLKEDQNLEDELIKFLRYYAESEETPLSKTKGTIKGYGKNLLLVMDGLDEVSPRHQEQVSKIIQSNNRDQRTVFLSASIILTSRPCKMEFSFLKLFEKHFRIIGLTDEKIEELVNKCFENDKGKLTKFENIYLPKSKFPKKRKNQIFPIERPSPLDIILICYSITQGMEQSFRSPKAFITNCARLMLRRCNVRNGLNFEDHKIEEILLLLGKTFLKKQREIETVFDSDFAKRELGDFYQLVVLSGIVRSVHKAEIDQVEMLEPAHKTFQDNLSAYHIETTWASYSILDRQNYLRSIFLLHYPFLYYVVETQRTSFFGDVGSFYFTPVPDGESNNIKLHVCHKDSLCSECKHVEFQARFQVTIEYAQAVKWMDVFNTLEVLFPVYSGKREYIKSFRDWEFLFSTEPTLSEVYFDIPAYEDGQSSPQPSSRKSTQEQTTGDSIPTTALSLTENVWEGIAFISVISNNHKGSSTGVFHKCMLAATRLLTTRVPDVSQAKSLKDSFIIWTDFIIQLDKTYKFKEMEIEVGKNKFTMARELKGDTGVLSCREVNSSLGLWIDVKSTNF